MSTFDAELTASGKNATGIEVPQSIVDASTTARAAFDALSFSNQRAHVLQVTGAKTDDTRARRVAKVVSELG